MFPCADSLELWTLWISIIAATQWDREEAFSRKGLPNPCPLPGRRKVDEG